VRCGECVWWFDGEYCRYRGGKRRVDPGDLMCAEGRARLRDELEKALGVNLRELTRDADLDALLVSLWVRYARRTGDGGYRPGGERVLLDLAYELEERGLIDGDGRPRDLDRGYAPGVS